MGVTFCRPPNLSLRTMSPSTSRFRRAPHRIRTQPAAREELAQTTDELMAYAYQFIDVAVTHWGGGEKLAQSPAHRLTRTDVEWLHELRN